MQQSRQQPTSPLSFMKRSDRQRASSASPLGRSTHPASPERNPAQDPTQYRAGCPHLLALKSNHSKWEGPPGPLEQLLESYTVIMRYALKWQHRGTGLIATEKSNLPCPQCHYCKSKGGNRLHACLHCVFFGCWRGDHIRQHLEEHDHAFAVELEHGFVYCRACNDYVHDLMLEQLAATERTKCLDLMAQQWQRNQQNGATRRRRRRLSESLTVRDRLLIESESKHQRCSTLRGLYNLGATCFMSCILQVFLHNPLLRDYFLIGGHDPSECSAQISNSNSSSVCLACEMDHLCVHFFNGEQGPVAPDRFLYAMWRSQRELAGYEQQDAHEFFIALLNQLHLNSRGHSHHCKCIIHRLFTGTMQSTVTCLSCGNVSHALDPFFDISLDLKHGQHVHTLRDCLQRFTRPEQLDGRIYSCSQCNNTLQACTKQLTLRTLPRILCLHLKRFEQLTTGSNKLNVPITFPLHLDMQSFVSSALLQAPSPDSSRSATPEPVLEKVTSVAPTSLPLALSDSLFRYRLYAVVTHQGTMDTGHYTAILRHRDAWFHLDDANVTLMRLSDVLSTQAYMLFYQRISDVQI